MLKSIKVVNYKPCGNIPGLYRYNVSDVSPLRDDSDTNSLTATDSDGTEKFPLVKLVMNPVFRSG